MQENHNIVVHFRCVYAVESDAKCQLFMMKMSIKDGACNINIVAYLFTVHN